MLLKNEKSEHLISFQLNCLKRPLCGEKVRRVWKRRLQHQQEGEKGLETEAATSARRPKVVILASLV